MNLVKLIKEYLRKKDEVLVAKLRLGLPFVYGDFDKNSIMVHYHCYESETGKRRFKVYDNSRGMINPNGNFKAFVKQWKKNHRDVFGIPNYSDIKSGLKKVYKF